MKVEQQNITSYSDINNILTILVKNLQDILRTQLIGVYLTGSLTYGDFDPGSSDIDLLVVLDSALSEEQRDKVKNLHDQIGIQYPEWAKRIECSYITKDMLQCIDPPTKPRPYVNGGKMWNPDPPYGNEWLINLYALYECGIALIGPDPKVLIGHSVDSKAVRYASKNDLHQEWEPLLKNSKPLKDSHLQAYVILTLCRILYRDKHDLIASKSVSSSWVKKTYGEPWIELIEKAENWQHGQTMNSINEILAFIRFVLKELQVTTHD